MNQVEIIKEAVGFREGEKNRGKRIQFLKYFNAGLGPFGVTRQTFCKWGKGHGRPEEKVLRQAMLVYSVDDPRYIMARDLLRECYGASV